MQWFRNMCVCFNPSSKRSLCITFGYDVSFLFYYIGTFEQSWLHFDQSDYFLKIRFRLSMFDKKAVKVTLVYFPPITLADKMSSCPVISNVKVYKFNVTFPSSFCLNRYLGRLLGLCDYSILHPPFIRLFCIY